MPSKAPNLRRLLRLRRRARRVFLRAERRIYSRQHADFRLLEATADFRIYDRTLDRYHFFSQRLERLLEDADEALGVTWPPRRRTR